MRKKSLLPLTVRATLVAFVCSLLGFATTTCAVPITNTVSVGNKEWAQVNLFTNLSWNDMNAVCPAGACGAVALNGFDMDGWTWASRTDVGNLLFKPFSTHPGGKANIFEVGDTLSNWLSTTGFVLTKGTLPVVGSGEAFIAGFTSDDDDATTGGLAVIDRAITVNGNQITDSTSFLSDVDDPKTISTNGFGGWFYRLSSVPEPSPLILLGLAFGIMGWHRVDTDKRYCWQYRRASMKRNNAHANSFAK